MGCFGGGTSTTTQVTSQTFDPVASKKLTEIAEKQQLMAEEQWDLYKEYFQEYEIKAADANLELLPYITEASKLTLAEQARDLEENRVLKDALRSAGITASDEQIRDLVQDRPLKDALREAGIAASAEQMRDLSLDRPLKDALREAGITATEEQARDLELNREVKDALRDAQLKGIERQEKELALAEPVAEKFYKESLEGVDLGKRAEEAGANVISALRSGRGAEGREMSRYGIDPGSSRFKSGLSERGIAAASMVAGARNRAIREGESENYARLGTAVGVRGRATGLPGIQTTQPGGGIQGGSVSSLPGVQTQGGGVSGLPGVQTTQGQGQTFFGSADPFARAQGGYSAAGSGYSTLASRVLSTTGTTTAPKSDFWDFAATALGTAAGAFAGGYGSSLGKG